MKHRSYWRSSRTGNPSRCQTSTTTCLTCWTMRAACSPQCRLVLDVQEVRTGNALCKFSRKVLSLDLLSLRLCMVIPHKQGDTFVLTSGRKSSLNLFSDRLVHNKYPLAIYLSKGIFVENIWCLEDTYYLFITNRIRLLIFSFFLSVFSLSLFSDEPVNVFLLKVPKKETLLKNLIFWFRP